MEPRAIVYGPGMGRTDGGERIKGERVEVAELFQVTYYLQLPFGVFVLLNLAENQAFTFIPHIKADKGNYLGVSS